MGKVLDNISEKEETFIRKQKVFFVATAPLSGDHHVNVSPKAPGTSVIVINPHLVAYADLTGSGSETASHVLENGRITLMFCNLEAGPPQILRLYGTAKVVIKEEVPDSLLNRFPEEITTSFGFRCIYIVDVHRISSSCGYSLPIVEFEKYRQVLAEYTTRKGKEGMDEYGVQKNSFSIDGLPSLAHLRNKGKIIAPDPQEGYVFGKEVANGVLSSNHRSIALACSRMLSHDQMITLAVGAVIGSILSSSYFMYLSEQSSSRR